ncbi:metallophosphoesterase family protein [Alteromonas sp. AMM-1]|uniref:metallophosphoesterase family protein n=1 Tax=Alteromonas sp. AMM-1 TaxID=3394233 RepID=UPI0039A5FF82
MLKTLMLNSALILALLCLETAKASTSDDTETSIRIAFLADIHLHDPYEAAKGLPDNGLPKDPLTGEPLLLRSMHGQLHSTRLFNENYWVLRAALDTIVQQGINLVALPGDFSDDGQPANITALTQVLDEYSERYNLRFYAINGNHDPTRPYSRPGGKTDFLSSDGSEIAVASQDHQACKNQQASLCTNALQEWGYAEIIATMSDHGFMPHQADLLFETPFGTKEMNRRHWDWCNHKNQCIAMPDSSYLVEPVEGVWLLAIDANVYEPVGDYSNRQFKGSGNAGYNALLHYKPKLIEWISDVAGRAKAKNKKLIAFSHFPMADFYDSQATTMAQLFGNQAMQLKRLPHQSTTEALAATGLTLHFAGHMHLYDLFTSEQHGLLNVQVPSLAAYQPGYTVLTVKQGNHANIETVVVKEVPNFNRWFTLYQTEWQYRLNQGITNWPASTLLTTNYSDFTNAHLKQVIRQRYLQHEWPKDLASVFTQHSVQRVLKLAGCPISDDLPSDFLESTAMLFIDDYYRARNAGEFAELEGDIKIYHQLYRHLVEGQCDGSLSSIRLEQRVNKVMQLILETLNSAQQDKQHFNIIL